MLIPTASPDRRAGWHAIRYRQVFQHLEYLSATEGRGYRQDRKEQASKWCETEHSFGFPVVGVWVGRPANSPNSPKPAFSPTHSLQGIRYPVTGRFYVCCASWCAVSKEREDCSCESIHVWKWHLVIQ